MTDSMECDVLVVGAGPAGLSAAIRLKQLNPDCNVMVLEKGSEVGAHILSGAVLDPRALVELFPDWQERGAPLHVPVTEDRFTLLTATRRFTLPTPPPMKNHGNYIISLANLCRWLSAQAEALGVQIFPGFPAADLILEDGVIRGIKTGAFGIARDGSHKHNYQPPMEIRAAHTLLAEGCRGSLTEVLKRIVLEPSPSGRGQGEGTSLEVNSTGTGFSASPSPNPLPGGEGSTPALAFSSLVSEQKSLNAGHWPLVTQTYGIGLKEIWRVAPEKHRQGTVEHSIGWPLDGGTYGGSFLYHLDDHQVAVGFVVGLDYQNPYLDPFKEFQRFKTHPAVRPLFEGGTRLSYGARALNEGGWQSIPQLDYPGASLIGCAAGFLNVPRIKGTHTAMKSGMLAAEAIFGSEGCLTPHATRPPAAARLAMEGYAPTEKPSEKCYESALRTSWVGQELYRVRNIRPAFRYGLWAGLAYAALDTYIFRGRAPWTFKHHADHTALKPAKDCQKIDYPPPDGVVSFDRLSSVYLSNTNHEEDQPAHLTLTDARVPIAHNLALYDAPEQRYCPAGVYEIVEDTSLRSPLAGEQDLHLQVRGGNTLPTLTSDRSKHYRLQINAQNCVHCKTCDIKDPTQNIVWTTPEGGGGPNYGNM